MAQSFKIKVGGTVWDEQKIYPDFIQTRTRSRDFIRTVFDNLKGASWEKDQKREFSGKALTYDEWRRDQQTRTGIRMFGVTASLEDEHGKILETAFLPDDPDQDSVRRDAKEELEKLRRVGEDIEKFLDKNTPYSLSRADLIHLQFANKFFTEALERLGWV